MQKNKKSILIVDDDIVLSRTIQLLLEEYGHVVSCCHNSFDAITLSMQSPFDLILIDYNMPELKGDLVCEFIREYQPDGYIVGLSSEFKKKAFLNAGANKFIHKGDLIDNITFLNQLIQQAS